MEASSLTIPEPLINHFIDKLIEDLEVVDQLRVSIHDGWFDLHVEGTKDVAAVLGVDYFITARFQLRLMDYGPAKQSLRFDQVERTLVQGKGSVSRFLTRFASDPIRDLIEGLSFTECKPEEYWFNFTGTPVASFFASKLAGVPMVELLPLQDIRLEEGVLELVFAVEDLPPLEPPTTE